MATALFRPCPGWSCWNNVRQGASLPSSPSRPRSLSLAFRVTSGKYILLSYAIAKSCTQLENSPLSRKTGSTEFEQSKAFFDLENQVISWMRMNSASNLRQEMWRPFHSLYPTSDDLNHRVLSHGSFFVGSWNHNSIGTSAHPPVAASCLSPTSPNFPRSTCFTKLAIHNLWIPVF